VRISLTEEVKIGCGVGRFVVVEFVVEGAVGRFCSRALEFCFSFGAGVAILEWVRHRFRCGCGFLHRVSTTLVEGRPPTCASRGRVLTNNHRFLEGRAIGGALSDWSGLVCKCSGLVCDWSELESPIMH